MSTNAPAPASDIPSSVQQPITGYDLSSHFLAAFQGKDPQQLHALVVQLLHTYGPEAVLQAAQNLAITAEGIRWQAYSAMAVAQGQPVQPHPYPQPNPFPVPNFAGAAQTVAAFQQANGSAT